MPHKRPKEPRPRNKAVDAFRLIAIAAVIVIHTQPFSFMSGSSEFYAYLYLILNQAAKFAIPFFFVIAGYYWGLNIRQGEPIAEISGRMLMRLALVFCVWSAVYLLPHDLPALEHTGALDMLRTAHQRLLRLAEDPATLILQGTKVHLWFLVGMAYALVITWLVLWAGLGVLLPFIAVALYLFGLAAKSYAMTPLGIDLFGFNTRNGPFFSTIFFVTGYYLAGRVPSPRWFKIGLLVFMLGILLHFTEIAALWKLYYVSPVSHDFVVGTYFMGLGAAMMALSGHALFHSARLAAVGRLTLGIYVIHVWFIEMAASFVPRSNFMIELLFPIGILTVSAGAAYLLAKSSLIRPIVV